MEKKSIINNELYHTLGDRWYTAQDDPVALLRSETKTKFPWVLTRIQSFFKEQNIASGIKVLDVGCGAGFLSNLLASENLQVTGLDISVESLSVAKKYDTTKKVQYVEGNAYMLPFADNSFDVITCMDFLEHIEDPERAIKEMSRVLKPNGQFFFHTFNRNPVAYLIIIKVVEWLVKNTPRHMHVLNLFIKPQELKQYCNNNNLILHEMTGIRPLFSTITLKGLLSRTVPVNFGFTLTKSLMLSYMGYATKQA